MISYNGELYNDAELRAELHREGMVFRSSCDTETVAQALRVWGPAAIGRFRGMFALAAVDVERARLILARDRLGIKPLYYAVGAGSDRVWQVVFASEPAPIVAHPDVGARPDMVTASAYLTTIRTTIGERTLFEEVRTVLPGEVIEFDLSVAAGAVHRTRHEVADWQVEHCGPTEDRVRKAVIDSVSRHLRADVPACALLSGGLDSSIIVAACRELGVDRLRTYSSGHDDGSDGTDLSFARMVAAKFGTVHTAAPITRELFAERWPDMVARMGIPLSTPNEVAINEVARRLRDDGQVVALSGEGADELFGGYELPMMQAWEFEEKRGHQGNEASTHQGDSGGAFQLRANAWISHEQKGAVLRPEVWRGVEGDAFLRDWYESEFARGHESGVQSHLAFQRRVNLVGLLQRLDTATMLEGVEGRTPFADVAVAAIAEAMPMDRKFAPSCPPHTRSNTKIALRQAFADVLPREVVERPKASFPLPFQEWVGESAPVLRSSGFARTMFSDAAIEAVCAEPGRLWNLAWPMINLAMWGERW